MYTVRHVFSRIRLSPCKDFPRKTEKFTILRGSNGEKGLIPFRQRLLFSSKNHSILEQNCLLATKYKGWQPQITLSRGLCTIDDMADNKFCADYDKRGMAACKKCKQKLTKGQMRLGKVTVNPFGDGGGDMKLWHHPQCLFDTFLRARASTKIIEDPSDVEGFNDLQDEDKDAIRDLIAGG
jgi:hypothetical protein